jgi:hypothetical protein
MIMPSKKGRGINIHKELYNITGRHVLQEIK